MQHLRAINLIVLLSALPCLAQAATAESAKTTAKTTPQFINDAVKPTAIKNLVVPMLHKNKADTEKKAVPAKVVPKVIPKVVPKAVLKVVPQPAKKSSQPPVAAKKMPKPFDSRNVVKPVADAKIKAGSSLLKQTAPPDRKPQPNTIIKSIPGVIGKSQTNVRQKAVAPVGTVKPANPASSRGGFQGLAESRGGVQATELESNITLPAVQKAHQPVKPLQIDPAGGVRVPISGGGAHLPLGVQLPDAQASPGMQGAPPFELREGLVLARENLRADLKIVAMLKHGRGQVAIAVKAIPEVAGSQPPMRSFPIRLKTGGEIVWEGYGQVKRMFFGSFGDLVLTSYVVGQQETRLQAEVNFHGMVGYYPESCPEGGCRNIYNIYQHTFNPAPAPAREVTAEVREAPRERALSEDFTTRVTDVRVVRRGPDWAIIGITYDLHERHTEGSSWYKFYVMPGVAGVPGETSLNHLETSDRILCSPEGRAWSRSRLPSSGRGAYVEARCQLQSGAEAFRSIIMASINVWQSRDNYLSAGWKRTPLLWWGHDDVPLVWDQDSFLSPDYVIDSVLIQRGASEKPVSLRVVARNIGSNLNRPVSIKVEFINQIDGVVATRHYEMRIDPRGTSELRVSLASMDDFEWRAGEYRYGTGTILVSLNSPRNIVESNYENNHRRVGVVDYAPRYR